MILFDEIIFGPVMSRRLGVSLGINLLPENRKLCNFNCVYCECGLSYNNKLAGSSYPSADTVKQKLAEKLQAMKVDGSKLDAITFAGNGEPTLHPEFSKIIDDTIEEKNKFYPQAIVSVLSNATMLHNESVFQALLKAERSILKLDSATESTLIKINRPSAGFSLQKTIENMKKFMGNFYLQTMFTRGKIDDQNIDNTTEDEVKAWIDVLKILRPKQVQIYTIHRTPPYSQLEIVPPAELEKIAEKVRALGIEVQVAK